MDKSSSLRIQGLVVKNFRCFSTYTVSLQAPLVVLSGDNGAGKTSLLEALYYACYLRSFRTHLPRELINFDASSFFIKVDLKLGDDGANNHSIQVGFAENKRLVKVNNQVVTSYKELMDYYRIVALTENDLQLIHGTPQVRRTFIDQTIMVNNPGYQDLLKNFLHNLESRNHLIAKGDRHSALYHHCTQELWRYSMQIRKERIDLLDILEKILHQLLATHFPTISLSLSYKPKDSYLTIEQLMDDQSLKNREERFLHSFFGAHLDDLVISFQERKSRSFASRGQQKLIAILLKISQLEIINKQKIKPVFIVDDFVSDFDESRIKTLIPLFSSLSNQLIFTIPTAQGSLFRLFTPDMEQINVTP